jgi:hypothetical protein
MICSFVRISQQDGQRQGAGGFARWYYTRAEQNMPGWIISLIKVIHYYIADRVEPIMIKCS